MSRVVAVPHAEVLLVNGQPECSGHYLTYHWRRLAWTLDLLHRIGARRIIEVGAHPWAMTGLLLDDPGFEVVATVSAEEVTAWPDDIGVRRDTYRIRTWAGSEAAVTNYSANIERTLFDIDAGTDTVVACEIIEHLIRAPHLMLLNINRWLRPGGRLLMTTPNGFQFSNPFRRRSPTAAYRAHIYERHSYVFGRDELVDLVELAGFRILEVGYTDLVDREGPSRVYGLLGRVPWRYFQDKFRKTIFLVAEKTGEVAELPRCPRVYDARGQWEYIGRQA